MTYIENLLEDAIEKLDLERNEFNERLTKAQIEVLNAGLNWFDEWEPYLLPNGEFAGADRHFKIAPWGRATVTLAKAILEGSE